MIPASPESTKTGNSTSSLAPTVWQTVQGKGLPATSPMPTSPSHQHVVLFSISQLPTSPGLSVNAACTGLDLAMGLHCG